MKVQVHEIISTDVAHGTLTNLYSGFIFKMSDKKI